MDKRFFRKSVLTAAQFKREHLNEIFRYAQGIHGIATREVKCQILNGYIAMLLFFEPSTRTHGSFSSAFLRLGGEVIDTHGMQFSSLLKGETFEDSIRVMSAYGDVLIIRSSKKGQVAEAAEICDKPVFNAGDGDGEHPTQALLDLYTIYREQGRIDGLTIAMVGDLKHSRTVHSLARLLTEFKNVQVRLVSPKVLQLPLELREWLEKGAISLVETENFDDGIAGADVVYMVRLQKERIEDMATVEKFQGVFILDRKKVERVCKSEVTILHPLPRTVEIATDVDALTRNAAYFRQSAYGVEVRAALFLLALGKEKKLVEIPAQCV